MKKKKANIKTKYISRTYSTTPLKRSIFKRTFEKVRRLCDLTGRPGIYAKKGQTDEIMWMKKYFTGRWSTRKQFLGHREKVTAMFGDKMITVLTKMKTKCR